MIGRWSRPTRLTWWATATSVLITAGTAVYLAVIYSTLPRGIPVQYVLGRPYVFDRKSPVIVALPVIVQTGLLVIFGALVLLLLWRATARMRLAAEGIALLAAVWIAMQALGAIRLVVLWRGAWGGYGSAYTLALIAAVLVSAVVMLRTMKLARGEPLRVAAENPLAWRLAVGVIVVIGLSGPFILARYILHGLTL